MDREISEKDKIENIIEKRKEKRKRLINHKEEKQYYHLKDDEKIKIIVERWKGNSNKKVAAKLGIKEATCSKI